MHASTRNRASDWVSLRSEQPDSHRVNSMAIYPKDEMHPTDEAFGRVSKNMVNPLGLEPAVRPPETLIKPLSARRMAHSNQCRY